MPGARQGVARPSSGRLPFDATGIISCHSRGNDRPTDRPNDRTSKQEREIAERLRLPDEGCRGGIEGVAREGPQPAAPGRTTTSIAQWCHFGVRDSWNPVSRTSTRLRTVTATDAGRRAVRRPRFAADNVAYAASYPSRRSSGRGEKRRQLYWDVALDWPIIAGPALPCTLPLVASLGGSRCTITS